MAITKLTALSSAISIVLGIGFVAYTSHNTEITQGIENLKQQAIEWKNTSNSRTTLLNTKLDELSTAEGTRDTYNNTLKALYKVISGSEATADTDLSSEAMTTMLEAKLSETADTQKTTILNSISEVLNCEATETAINEAITTLQAEIERLNNEIAEYKADEQTLLGQIATLQKQVEQANAQLTLANNEEQAQYEAVTTALEEVESIEEVKLNEVTNNGTAEPTIPQMTLEEAEANLKTALSNEGLGSVTINKIINGAYIVEYDGNSVKYQYESGSNKIRYAQGELKTAFINWLALK